MNLKKMSLLKAIITFPAGFAKEAQAEIDNILTHLWLPKNQKPFINLQKNNILLKNVHIDTLFELLFRSSVITDVRLVIFESQVKNKSMLKAVCDKIKWDDYLDHSHPLKIKANSIASELFHEKAIKEIVAAAVLNLSTASAQIPLNFEGTDEADTLEERNNHSLNRLFVDLLKNTLTISVSLPGEELYKRNYKQTLTASAPLREDMAHFCLKKTTQFLLQSASDKKISTLFVPFGGTGTFIFEYLIMLARLSNNFFGKKFIFESTNLFKEKTYGFLNKKSLQESEQAEFNLKQIVYTDIVDNTSKIFSENLETFTKKLKERSSDLFQKIQNIQIQNQVGNFLKLDVKSFIDGFKENEVILMPLNPPYGLRQQSKVDNEQFYTKIIYKVNEVGAALKLKQGIVCGFILCPSEETWSLATNKLHTEYKETFHFTQGGVHIRTIMFVYSNAPNPVNS